MKDINPPMGRHEDTDEDKDMMDEHLKNAVSDIKTREDFNAFEAVTIAQEILKSNKRKDMLQEAILALILEKIAEY